MRKIIFNIIFLIVINQSFLFAQSESSFTNVNSWTPSKNLLDLKVSDSLVLTLSTNKKVSDLKFLKTKKLEQLRNFKECISNPTINGSHRKNIVNEELRGIEIASWLLNKNKLEIKINCETIDLEIISYKKDVNFTINEIVFLVSNKEKCNK